MKLLTLREAYVQASSFFESKQIGQDPQRTARWLLEYFTGYRLSELMLRWDEPFPEDRIEQWRQALERKGKGEPVQYIIGEQEFYGLPFAVNPDVLIPRPETEILVEEVLKLAEGRFKDSNPTVADIGTGSGAIAVTVAAKAPGWDRIIASDLSAGALKTAKENAARHQVLHKITFVQGDLMQPLIEQSVVIDVLVSNPPYIPSKDIPLLQAEVKDYEPVLALDGGEDGLEVYRRLFEQMSQLDVPPAWVGLEVGQGQSAAVKEMMEQLKLWDVVETVRDLSGIERHVIAKR